MASVAVAAPLWAACGSSGSSGSGGGGAHAAAAPAALCQKILAVYSDGPDPDADPVGYALSQIKPLGQIHTSDHTVSATLGKVIAADRALVSSNGKDHAATKAIATADKTLTSACPGVAS
jgi:hypothetical protein